MHTLKGDKNSESSQTMKKALGMGKPSSSSAAAAASGPAEMARTLGLPSALGQSAAAQPAVSKDPSRAKDAAAEDKRENGNEHEDDDDQTLAALREKRVQQLKKQAEKQKELQALGHGEYTEITEDEFLNAVTKSKYVVCHFYHKEFERCKIIDKHLEILAKKYFPTRFVKINADKSPFFSSKLQVRVLPSLIFFKDGVAVDRMIGFDEIGGKDDFPTRVLELRIAQSGIIVLPPEEQPSKAKAKGANKSQIRSIEADSDDDNDDRDDD